MSGLRADGHSKVDPEGLIEFSVVFTDRSLNHMSQKFQQVMRDISAIAREVYNADAVALVPGGGTYAMEAVARQFARESDALIVRNGLFSFRWSQIIEAAGFDGTAIVQPARPEGNAPAPPMRRRRSRMWWPRSAAAALGGVRAACGDGGRADPARRLYRGAGGGGA